MDFSVRRAMDRLLAGLLVIAASAAAPSAAAPAAALTHDQMLDLVRSSVEKAAQSVMANQPGLRVETEVGTIHSQLKLAPCEVAQPHLNPGTRVWGEIRIGLRCVQGPVRWNVFIPAVVRVYGPAWVASAPLPLGHVVTETDLTVQEAEWTAETGPVLSPQEVPTGRIVSTALKAGQAVRTQHLRARQWFGAGQSVTLIARGPGFAVSSEGVALMPGLEGQTTTVRLESGRVVQGKAVGSRRVEVTL